MSEQNGKQEKNNLNAGHRTRLRKRFMENPDSLAEHEILELLLTFAIPRKDCKTLAKKLLGQFGSLDAVLDAPPGELESFEGFGETSLALFKTISEIESRKAYERLVGPKKRRKISSPSDALEFARAKIAGRQDEAFLVIYLDVKNKILGYEIVQEGTVNQAVVYPRKIIEGALKRAAAAIILAHNHPSGETSPSRHDIKLTEEIAKAAEPMDITVLDHIVVGKRESFSFKDQGLL